MRPKDMGSAAELITAVEAAKILGVTVSQTHTLHRNGFIEAYYPEGRRPNQLAGKYFRQEDVLLLKELREQLKDEPTAKLRQLAMRAVITSRRVERRLAELANYFGLDDVAPSLEKDQVVAFYVRVKEFTEDPRVRSQEDAIALAKRLLGVTEEYLELVALHTGDHEPWKVFLQTGKLLAGQFSPGTQVRVFIDHARRNMRNVCYFYIKGTCGTQVADKMFPQEGYSNALIQTMFPTH